FHRHSAIEQQREIEAQAKFERAGHDRIECRVEDREPEYLVVRERNEVGEADEAARLANRGGGHAEPEAQAKRIGKKHQQERRRRRDHEEAKNIAVVEQTKGKSL